MAQESKACISIIAAIGTRTRAIGKDGKLLWQLPEDMKRFRLLTNGHPVIMGGNTWASLPENYRPLPGRTNIVVSLDASFEAPGATVVHSIDEAFKAAASAAGSDEVFVIGGGQIYAATIDRADRLYLTLVDDDTEGDTSFPPYPAYTKVVEEERHEGAPSFTFITLERE